MSNTIETKPVPQPQVRQAVVDQNQQNNQGGSATFSTNDVSEITIPPRLSTYVSVNTKDSSGKFGSLIESAQRAFQASDYGVNDDSDQTSAPTQGGNTDSKPVDTKEKSILSGALKIDIDELKMLKSTDCGLRVGSMGQFGILEINGGGTVRPMVVMANWLGQGDQLFNTSAIASAEPFPMVMDSPVTASFNAAQFNSSMNAVSIQREMFLVLDKSVTTDGLQDYLQENIPKMNTDTNFKGMVRADDSITVFLGKNGKPEGYIYSYRELINGSEKEDDKKQKTLDYKNHLTFKCIASDAKK